MRVPEPELAGDAPVADVLHPVEVDLGEAVGHELDAAAGHRLDGRRRQGGHVKEPLLAHQRLDQGVAALAVADAVGVGLRLHQIAAFLQVFDDGGAAFEAVHPLVAARVLSHRRVEGDADDGLQVVALADLKVHDVVAGGYLESAGAEGGVDRFVGDDGDVALDDGQEHLPADHRLVALVGGVHGDGDVGEDRLRPRGGDGDVLAASLPGVVEERVADVPEVALRLVVLDLQVGDGGVAARAPVGDPLAAIDEAVVVELDEGGADGLGGPGSRVKHSRCPVGRRRPAACAGRLCLLAVLL